VGPLGQKSKTQIHSAILEEICPHSKVDILHYTWKINIPPALPMLSLRSQCFVALCRAVFSNGWQQFCQCKSDRVSTHDTFLVSLVGPLGQKVRRSVSDRISAKSIQPYWRRYVLTDRQTDRQQTWYPTLQYNLLCHCCHYVHGALWHYAEQPSQTDQSSASIASTNHVASYNSSSFQWLR